MNQNFYVSEKNCKNGCAPTFRYYKNNKCVSCRKKSCQKYKTKNPEAIKVLRKEYDSTNREKINQRQKLYRDTHKEKFINIYKNWYKKNREEKIEYARKRREKNPEKCKIAVQKWSFKNKDKIKKYISENKEKRAAIERNRRARKNSSFDKHTEEDVFQLLKNQKNKCSSCLSILKKYHVDHIYPLSKGGSNGKENIQILCPPCNLSKHAKDPFQWANENGRLL